MFLIGPMRFVDTVRSHIAAVGYVGPGAGWIHQHHGLFLLLVVWVVAWKGIALWTAARNGSKPWFVVLLIVNTLGLLEILYIFVFSRRRKDTLDSH